MPDLTEENRMAMQVLSAARRRSLSGHRLLGLPLLLSAMTAQAMPPPPPVPPLLRTARMTVTVQLIEANNGIVTRITELCKVGGKIPVYADNGDAAIVHPWEIAGCKMPRHGKNLNVNVHGAKAMSKKAISYAFAYVSVIPPDAVSLCGSMCGPQPLADARAEIRVSGAARRMTFSLNPNPVSILNAKPTVWLEANVEIVD
jgi:hypothetical protein